MANELARDLADRLRPVAPGRAGELDALIAAAEAGTATRAQAEAFAAAARSEVAGLIGDALGVVPGLRDAVQAVAPALEGWHPSVQIGPAAVGVDCSAATVTIAGQSVVVGLLPPSGAHLSLAAGPASGGGLVILTPTSVTGSLGLSLGVVEVVGFAQLQLQGGTPSLVVVMGAHFTPAVQLSFGFMLSGVGGVIGVNRRIDGDALRNRLASGTALDALFPDDPVKGAAGVLAALGDIFPPTAGQHVVGPTLTLTWLDLGPLGSLVRLDLGLLLQLPDVRIVLAGRGQVSLPPFLALRLDAVGEIDPGGQRISVDAVLVDSRALGIFQVTGSAALRLSWGSPPYALVSLGGFFPGFRPEPAPVPPQQRLALALDIPCPLTFRAEGYLAITSGTFQVGAHIDVGIDLSVIAAYGFLGFDAFIQLDPFHLRADYEAGWEVEIGPFSGGTTVSGWIDGPGPWKVHAAVSISLLFDDLTWSDTFTFGSGGPSGPPPVAHLVDLVAGTLGDTTHLQAADARDPLVVVAPDGATVPKGQALASPLAALTWTQALVPLDLRVSRASGKRLASEQALHIAVTVGGGAAATGEHQEWFAPGTFLDVERGGGAQPAAVPTPEGRLRAAGPGPGWHRHGRRPQLRGVPPAPRRLDVARRERPRRDRPRRARRPGWARCAGDRGRPQRAGHGERRGLVDRRARRRCSHRAAQRRARAGQRAGVRRDGPARGRGPGRGRCDLMADSHFLSWRRRGGTAIAAGGGRRPVLQLAVDATDDSGGAASGAPTQLLHGPGDVTGLQPGALTATFPRPGQVDVEPAYCPYAELAAADLPWRYSPTGGTPDVMVPWLALVVAQLGGPAPEVEVVGHTAVVQPSALPSARSVELGGHVQRTPSAPGGHEVARLLSLQPLVADRAYLALVVPVFAPDGSRRWADGAGAAVELPVYASWTFQTGAAETFETLAEALHAADDINDFGRITIDVGAGVVEARGALTAINGPPDPPPAAVPTARLAELLAFDPDAAPPPHEPGTDVEGRRYVRPPEYGDAWVRQPLLGAPDGGWVDQVNRDLRHRAVAGLGVQAGLDLQDELAAAAAARFGATAAANGRLAALVAGLRAAASLWDRRLPADRDQRLRLLGLSASRIASVAEGDPAGTIAPLLDRATGTDRTLPPALFSTAGQRVLRRRASRLRASTIDPARLVEQANQGRATVRRPDDAPGDPRHHDGVAHADAMVADLGGVGIRGRDVRDGDGLIAALLETQDLPDGVRPAVVELVGGERAEPRPTDLGALDDALVRAFDPRRDPAAVGRVRATIHPDDGTLGHARALPRPRPAGLALPPGPPAGVAPPRRAHAPSR